MKFQSNVRPAEPLKTKFDLSREVKLSVDMGKLYPVLCEEILPGDKWKVQSENMVRMAPMIAPIYHRINVYLHYFFVPMRLLWEEWEEFITGQLEVTPPKTTLTTVSEGSLADYLGIPPGTYNLSEQINIMPFLAYLKIWNDCYRDENLQVEIDLKDPQLWNNMLGQPVKTRCWEKDYFTTCMPWAQKGDPVKVPVETSGPIVLNADGERLVNEDRMILKTLTGDIKANITGANNTSDLLQIESGLQVDIQDLRFAEKMQKFLERNARGGTRYIEHLWAHWGKRSSDARLQRAEYLGGGKSPITVSEVLNTTGTEDAPQGGMSGHGINIGRSNSMYQEFEEHGYLIGILSILPESGYQDGLHKKFSRLTMLDYPFPDFAQLGEQEVLNKEVMLGTSQAVNNEVFGYQGRYAELKTGFSTAHGAFRNTLDHWHLLRKFDKQNPPTLNSVFIQAIPDEFDRIFAVEAGRNEQCYVQIYHDIEADRPLPLYSEPSL